MVDSIEEHVLLHHPLPELLQLPGLVIVLAVHPVLQVHAGLLPVRDLLVDPLIDDLVLRLSCHDLTITPLVQC